MGKYKLNSNGKIYSDFAYRLGVIVQQYEKFELDEEERFESTLYVCALQSLSTQFCELNPEENTVSNEVLPKWGLEEAQIKKFPENHQPNLGNVIVNIRDSLSHLFADKNCLVYDSNSENGKIIEYEFSRPKNFHMTISVTSIRTLVLELSKYLSAKSEDVA